MESESKSPLLSRRSLALLVGAVPLLAQTPTPAPPEQSLQKALADVHGVSQRLSETEVPLDVEPAFIFRA
jgi:hypothetical protein